MYGDVNRKKHPDGDYYKDYFYYACKHRKLVDGHRPDDGPFAHSLQPLRRQNQAWFGYEMQCRSLCSFLCPSAALGIVCTNAGIGNIGYAGSFFSVAALIISFFFLSASVPGENAEHWTKWWKIIHKCVLLSVDLSSVEQYFHDFQHFMLEWSWTDKNQKGMICNESD